MTLLEQIRYYRAMASYYRALNHRLKAKYQILYASPLYDGKRGLADDAHDAYSEKWVNMNQSLQSLHDSWKGRYDNLESRRLSTIDYDAITMYQSAYDEIVEY